MDYMEMDKPALEVELQKLTTEYNRFCQMNLKLDMSRGKPSPDQLDLSLGLLTNDVYKDETGTDGRNYGQLEGMPEARRYFAQLMGAEPEETAVGGNSSLHLMYLCADLACRQGFADSPEPWAKAGKYKVLCPTPGYDRHFRVTESLGFELVEVAMTPDGLDMDEVEKLVQDASVKAIWCVPMYSNPDGYTYSDETVRRMAAMKTAAPDFRVFWDNAYGFHHLTDEPAHLLNILDACKTAGNPNRPLMFMSTSKITFAGAGVGALAASEANIKAYLDFLFPMMISFDKVNQIRHVRFLQQQGGVAAHMKKHAAILVPKFQTVLSTLQNGLAGCGNIANWTQPKGGYFVSFYTLPGCAARVVQMCKQAGVVLTGAGAAYPYGKDVQDHHIRIAPSFPPVEELEIAVQLLCVAARIASVEKLLQQ